MTTFTNGEIMTIEVCLELSREMWKSSLLKEDLPGGWEPDRAKAMISNIEALIKKFEDFRLFEDFYSKENEE